MNKKFAKFTSSDISLLLWSFSSSAEIPLRDFSPIPFSIADWVAFRARFDLSNPRDHEDRFFTFFRGNDLQVQRNTIKNKTSENAKIQESSNCLI